MYYSLISKEKKILHRKAKELSEQKEYLRDPTFYINMLLNKMRVGSNTPDKDNKQTIEGEVKDQSLYFSMPEIKKRENSVTFKQESTQSKYNPQLVLRQAL